MVIFSPWAFGTTQAWSVWTMNGCGYVLALLLGIKVSIRRLKQYDPPRWERTEDGGETGGGRNSSAGLTSVMAWLTVAVLGYTLVSAANARSTWRAGALSFEYHEFSAWLPHSLDSGATWRVFWNYLALAASFWAVRDWLLGKTSDEERAGRQPPLWTGHAGGPLFPGRLRRLLWVLSINGGLLALEGMVQRWEGSGRLLWLVRPEVNPGASTQFGPYVYRANGAQYLNLVWPVSLGFWWTLHRGSGVWRQWHQVLLVAGVLMAAGPVISTSRGGALVSWGLVAMGGLALGLTQVWMSGAGTQSRTRRLATAGVVLGFFAVSLGVGLGLGWAELKPRLRALGEDYQGREEMYDRARPMAADYAAFGTGPGTFETVFQLYRVSRETYWPAQLHNDWLETRITFGWVGSVLVWSGLCVVAARWFGRGGIHGGRRFMMLTWLGLGGCLAHARFDFPFQVYSILFLFLVLCAVVFCLSKRG